MANFLELFLHVIIHDGQTGFMKERNSNTGNNFRNIIDLIDYCDSNDIPSSIGLLDIENAFDSVEHNYLFHVSEAFIFDLNFIQLVKTFYCKSYVSDNGFPSESISMSVRFCPFCFLKLLRCLQFQSGTMRT